MLPRTLMSMPPLMPTLRCSAAATLAPNSWPKPAQKHAVRFQGTNISARVTTLPAQASFPDRDKPLSQHQGDVRCRQQ